MSESSGSDRPKLSTNQKLLETRYLQDYLDQVKCAIEEVCMIKPDLELPPEAIVRIFGEWFIEKASLLGMRLAPPMAT